MGTNGILVEERTSLGLQLYAKLVEFYGCKWYQERNGFHLAFNCMLNWLVVYGYKLHLGKERTSLGLQLYAKLVGCLGVQMVSLSRNGLRLAFNCMLNWLIVYGCKSYLARNGLHLAFECMLTWLNVYGYKLYPCQGSDFTWLSIMC